MKTQYSQLPKAASVNSTDIVAVQQSDGGLRQTTVAGLLSELEEGAVQPILNGTSGYFATSTGEAGIIEFVEPNIGLGPAILDQYGNASAFTVRPTGSTIASSLAVIAYDALNAIPQGGTISSSTIAANASAFPTVAQVIGATGLSNGQNLYVTEFATGQGSGGGTFIVTAASGAIPDQYINICPSALLGNAATSGTLFTGNGSTTTFTGTLPSYPLVPSSPNCPAPLTITVGSVVAADRGNGTLAGTGVSSATINYLTGAYSITYTTAPANAAAAKNNAYSYATSALRASRQFVDGVLRPEYFGAFGNFSYANNTGQDDTTAIMTCFAFAIGPLGVLQQSQEAVRKIVFGPNSYLISESINGTYLFPSQYQGGLIIEGCGPFVSAIYTEQTDAYPVLDLGGQNSATVRDMAINKVSSGSAATSAVLFSNTPLNNFGGQNCKLENVYTNMGFDSIGSDQTVFERCNVISASRNCITVGQDNPYGIASKYNTIVTGKSSSYATIKDCVLNSQSTAYEAIWATTLAYHLNIFGGYATINAATTSSPGIIKLGTGSNAPPSLNCYGIVIENNQNLPNLCAFYVATTAAIQGVHINGTFNLGTASTAYLIGTNGGAIIGLSLDCDAISGGGICGPGTYLSSVTGDIGAGGLPSSAISGQNIALAGISNAATYLASSTTIPNLDLSDDQGNKYVSVSPWYYNGANSAAPLFLQTKCLEQSIGNTAYTGGSGLQQINTFTIPAKMLIKPPISGATAAQPLANRKRQMTVTYWGYVQSTAAASGEIEIQVVQGSNTVTLLAQTGLAAYLSSNPGFKLEIHFLDNSGNGTLLKYHVMLFYQGAIYSAYGELDGSGILPTGSLALNVLVSNTGNSPYNFESIEVSV